MNVGTQKAIELAQKLKCIGNVYGVVIKLIDHEQPLVVEFGVIDASFMYIGWFDKAGCSFFARASVFDTEVFSLVDRMIQCPPNHLLEVAHKTPR